MKILLIRFSSIGDIVLTTPVIRCIKNKYPNAEIHYVTKKSFHSVLQHHPLIDKIHLLEDSVFHLGMNLKNEHFDFVIDLHHNQRSLLLRYLLGASSSSFNKINFQKWVMVNLKINLLPRQHIVERYLNTCAPLEVEDDGAGLDYYISEADYSATGKLPESFHAGYMGWVIGAKQKTKQFPSDKIIRILNRLKYPVVLLGGKEDEANGENIIQNVAAESTPVLNACGRFRLNESAALVKQAKLILTNDTGLMHIAAAFRKPLITFWGNTIPEFGMYPYFRNGYSMTFEIKNLSCRPCSKLGYTSCPRKHFDCMNRLDENDIVETIKQFLTQNISTHE